MQFLIDADLPRSAAGVFRRYGYPAIDVRDIGMRKAKDFQIAAYAQAEKLCLVTGDYDFANILNYPPGQYSGIVVLRLPPATTARYVEELLEIFLQQSDILIQLNGKLAIVEPGHVRLRAG